MQKLTVLLIAFFLHNALFSQVDDLDNRLQFITVTVNSKLGNQSKDATGFLFFDSASTDKRGYWQQMNNLWLVTNRHAVLFKDAKGREHLTDEFTFYLRKYVNDSTLGWLPVKISSQELQRRLKVHKDSTVDVACIDIFNLITDNMYKSKLMIFLPLSAHDFPDSTFPVNVTDNINVIGYPKDFYDKYNLYPIVKSGSIASGWGYFYNGNPYFVIDSKLFPGSSGSVVISRPSNFKVVNKKLLFSGDKQFVFLGIFSGELYNNPSETFDTGEMIITKREKYDIGIVWYYSVIPYILINGVQFSY